ncbi:deleted in malignant brain tumors 1 protein-like [Gigantopelta aegis]|uniref:deleted in malignant brain tumors 1 protein-like n=1 Tax=Gigantopelta aegis TaxID=1735272 RepID=UPI001B888608|nr:deleted in malignant brain tumors 1 protein-like [Gigantopelta aegis]
MMGFNRYKARAMTRAAFGQGSGPIFFQSLSCLSSDSSILDCRVNPSGNKNCSHSEDSGVICQTGIIEKSAVRLVNGTSVHEGRVEIFHNGQWGSICDDGFYNEEAWVVCRHLGLPSYGARAYQSARFGHSTGPIWLDDVTCSGDEHRLDQCSSNPWGENDCQHGEDVSVQCPLPIRLVNGSGIPTQGRVEIQINGTWGTVCDDQFDYRDAGVICLMMGFSRYGARAVDDAGFGNGSGPIFFDDLACRGNESHITDCPGNPIGDHNCHHNEDAGVICQTIHVRLVNGSGIATQGRVEVQINGTWGTVCGDGFSSRDARVICHTMGFSRYGAVTMLNAAFGRGSGPIFFDDLACRGNDLVITDCPGNPIRKHTCEHSKDAGVICQTICVRLVNGATRYEGRVEVLYNNRWGSVCDDGFHQNEAEVVCRSLSLPSHNAHAYGSGHFGRGVGQMWLRGVNCKGYEQHLEHCHFSSWYNNICHHGKDVGVSCRFGPDSVTFSPPTPGLVVEGDSLNITCVTDCHPPCSYSWAPGSSHFTSRPVLTLSNINISQTGSTYTCTAKNIGSDASRSNQFLLIVHSTPSIPSNISTRSISPTVVSITWVEEFNGGSAQMFLVQYQGDAISQWTNFTELFSERGIGKKHTIRIPDLHPKTKYLLRVLAFNKYGYKDFTEEQEILTAEASVPNKVDILPVAVGSVSGLIILILLLVVAVLVCRRSNNKGMEHLTEIRKTHGLES